ncbi:MAG: polysaccharide biosynthesis tyrosine autokinase [Deltaproteobacteria bacterium]|nr:polysaccharide biosynthesis tyrosine autokinase [Deltaproteobacteria bacterium]
MSKKEKANKNKVTSLLNNLLNNYPVQSHFSESYRTLRTNVSFSFMKQNFQTLLITSAGEQEGKTTTSANLAYTMAQAGNSVLLIDADMRKPTISLLKPMRSSPGLSGLLSEVLNTDVRSGSLSEFGLGDLYRLISFQKKTGILHLSRGEERVDLHFSHGELSDAEWLTRPPGKSLGTVLVNNQVISRDQLEQVLVSQKGTGQKLGFMLLNMGLVKKEDLTGFIVLHIIEACRFGFQFKTGEFVFEKLSESDIESDVFTPEDLPKLYKQAMVGEEKLHFLEEKIESAIVDIDIENLSVLPSGLPPPNPAELLASKRMSFLISLLKRQFDIIIIDTPPILPASDAMILAPHTDGVLFVIKSGYLKRELVKKAVVQIKKTQANLIGVVLNQVDVKRARYSSGKYYATYYGESD